MCHSLPSSAGVGRTGTFIVLDTLLQSIKENDSVDIFGLVCQMRQQRNHMIQTEAQYVFIHKVLLQVVRPTTFSMLSKQSNNYQPMLSPSEEGREEREGRGGEGREERGGEGRGGEGRRVVSVLKRKLWNHIACASCTYVSCVFLAFIHNVHHFCTHSPPLTWSHPLTHNHAPLPITASFSEEYDYEASQRTETERFHMEETNV